MNNTTLIPDGKNLTDDQIKAIWKTFKKDYKAETGWAGVARMSAAQLAKRTATIRIYWKYYKKETAYDCSNSHDLYENHMALESVKNVIAKLHATAKLEYSGNGFYGGPVAKIRLNF